MTTAGENANKADWFRYEYTRDGLTLEFQLQSTADPRKKYHFLWFYFYKAPGTFTINYVNTTDKGAGATVGIQGGEYIPSVFDLPDCTSNFSSCR